MLNIGVQRGNLISFAAKARSKALAKNSCRCSPRHPFLPMIKYLYAASLEKLRKFFRLEHENGYSNSAIIGGLAKMLDFWEGEARADGINEEVIQAVVQRLR